MMAAIAEDRDTPDLSGEIAARLSAAFEEIDKLRADNNRLRQALGDRADMMPLKAAARSADAPYEWARRLVARGIVIAEQDRARGRIRVSLPSLLQAVRERLRR